MKWMQKITFLSCLLAGQSVMAASLFAEGDSLLFQTSVWTKHYNPEPEHNNTQRLINFEYTFAEAPFNFLVSDGERLAWRNDTRWLAGAATFKNSYSQQTNYLYVGGRYDFPLRQHTQAYVKLTGGLIHGYRGEYRDKIPFNHFEIAPVILPAIGVQYRRANVELIPFAAAGVMLNVGFYLFD